MNTPENVLAFLNRPTEGKYRLEGKEVVSCKTLGEWATFMESPRARIVLQEKIYPLLWPFFGRKKKSWVSTVFLGIDHGFAALLNNEVAPPVLFETMVFGGPVSDEQRRCCTYDEAVEMHHQTCMDVEDAVWGPLPR